MKALAAWLLDEGSVSEKLSNQFAEPKIEVLFAGWSDKTPYNKAFVRRVVIWVKGEAFMYAESFLPHESLSPENQFFIDLGQGILGHHLFKKSKAKRLSMTHHLCRAAGLPGAKLEKGVCPERRSGFSLNGHPFYLHEYFLPRFVASIENCS